MRQIGDIVVNYSCKVGAVAIARTEKINVESFRIVLKCVRFPRTDHLPNLSPIFVYINTRDFSSEERSQCRTSCTILKRAHGNHILIQIGGDTLPEQKIICHLNVCDMTCAIASAAWWEPSHCRADASWDINSWTYIYVFLCMFMSEVSLTLVLTDQALTVPGLTPEPKHRYVHRFPTITFYNKLSMYYHELLCQTHSI